MTIIEHDYMVEAFASYRPDQAFHKTILPRRSLRDGVVANAHRSHAPGEYLTECSVIVAHDVPWHRLPRKCLRDLLGKPFGSRMGRDT